MKMHIREYNSSIDRNLKLTAEFHVPSSPKPLCLFFHGWHMTAASSRKAGSIQPLLEDFFLVNVDMRGRGGSSGKPDASGHELIDGLDALAYAEGKWKEKVSGEAVFAVGGSGGGGNVLALSGKAPDLFSAAVSWAGMSDYAAWYRGDMKGRYRDEMEEKGWIGGSPDTNPGGYLSRSGIALVGNVFTKLFLIHGRKDAAVPVASAEMYEARAKELGKGNISVHYNDMGHSSMEWRLALAHLKENKSLPRIPGKGRLLVHSFLALRSFWLVLGEPSEMGYADYTLDGRGNLESLSFQRTSPAGKEKSCLLRLLSPGGSVVVEDEKGKKREASLISPGKNYRDFLFRGEGSFHVQVFT